MSQRTLNATFMINGIPLVTIPVAVHNLHYICSHLYGFIVFKGCHHHPLFLECLLTPPDASWWSFTSHEKKKQRKILKSCLLFPKSSSDDQFFWCFFACWRNRCFSGVFPRKIKVKDLWIIYLLSMAVIHSMAIFLQINV